MTTITVPRAVLEQALEALIHMCHNTLADKGYDGQLVQDAIDGLKGALAQPNEDYERGFVDGMSEQAKRSVDRAVNALAHPEQEPVAYTGDVARRMREAGMTFHLGMPHAVVMEQMTRFHDIVCAEASIKAAAAFAHPPRRETEQEPVAWTDRELQLIDGMIEVQLHHAAQCDAIANRPMAERQKGWDMERVALLRKIKSISPRREPEQEQEQEPVAWLTEDSDRVVTQKTKSQMLRDGGAASSSMAPYCVPAFSTPPRREWQSLSEEEINELSHTMVKGHKSVNWLARAIEAKLKEKNNG